MIYSEFLLHSTGLIFRPFKTLSTISEDYREKIFPFGLITSLFSIFSLLLAGLIIRDSIAVNGVGFFISYMIFSLIIHYVVVFLCLGIIYFILGLSKTESSALELSGLFLSSDFPYLLLLPFAIIVRALPPEFYPVYALFYFLIFIVIVLLKMKSISIAAKISEIKSLGLLILPLALLVIVSALSSIFMIIFLFNAIK